VRDLVVTPGPATVEKSVGQGSLAAAQKLSEVTTDADGRFVLGVDTGTYELGLIPPPMSALARQWIDPVAVTTNTDLGDLAMPVGVMVRAVVVDPSGHPVAGASLKLYTVPASNSACTGADAACLSPARLRAEGTSGSDGTVPMLLPAAR
jgi:hypothetical protein